MTFSRAGYRRRMPAWGKGVWTGDAFFWSNSQQDLEVADSVVYDSIKTLAASVAGARRS